MRVFKLDQDMISRRKLRIMAGIILILLVCSALLGWDLVYQETLAQKFMRRPTGSDIF